MSKLTFFTQKSILLICLLSLSFTGAIAQYSVGVKGGVNFCNYSGKYITSNYEEKTRANFGLVAELQRNSWFNLQAELIYDGKGASYSYVTTSSSLYTEEYNDFTEKLDYLSLPILAKFDIGEKNRIFGYTGLYLAYLMSAHRKGTYIKTSNFAPFDKETQNIDRDYKSDISNFDMGAVFGIGGDISLSDMLTLFIDGRYNWGWLNVAEDGQGQIFNSSWTINLGLLYKLN
jgi:hypothetical protein